MISLRHPISSLSFVIYDTNSVFTSLANMDRGLPSIRSLGLLTLTLADVLAMPTEDNIVLPPPQDYPGPQHLTASSSGPPLGPRTTALSRGAHSGAARTKKKPRRVPRPYTLPHNAKSLSPMPGPLLDLSSDPPTSGTSDIVARRGVQADSREFVWSVEAGMDGLVLPVPQGQAGQGDEDKDEGRGEGSSSGTTRRRKMVFHYYSFDEDGRRTEWVS
jgi:hypothetical protein